MKRRTLYKTKKLMTIILAASMATSLSVPSLAVTNPQSDPVIVDASNQDQKETVTKNATAGNNDNAAVDVKSDNGHKADVTLKDSAEATATTRTSTSIGVKASSDDNNSSTKVSIEGNVSTDTKSGKAIGVSADSQNGGSTTVDVNGRTSAVSESTNKEAIGIDDSSGETSSTVVTTHGDVSAKAKDKAKGSQVTAFGNDANSELNVKNGGINAESENKAFGLQVAAKDGNSSVKVNVDRDIQASSSGSLSNSSSKGIHINEVKDGGVIDINIGGNVNSVGTGNNTMAYGMDLNDYTRAGGFIDGNANIHVTGSVNSSSKNNTAFGIFGTIGKGDVTVNVNGDVHALSNAKAAAISLSNKDGDVDINVGGNVHQEGAEGYAIGLFDDTQNTDISVSVANNVTSSNTAVKIEKSEDDSSIDLFVGGTISGVDHNIVLSDQCSTDNLNITVWKVDTSNDKKVVETDTGSSHVQNAEAEKKINYIIKVDSVSTSTGGKLAVSGTTKSHGYDTAHEGDDVYLEVAVPSGYEIARFYNVNGAAKCEFLVSSDGKHYLKVPKGGGVFVGVNLKKITNDNYDNDDDDDDNGSGNQPQNPQNNDLTNVIYPTTATVMAMSIQIPTIAGTNAIANVADVLKPIDKITAINNFSASGANTLNTGNIMGAGMVSFNNMFATAVSDTIDVPVAANVMANQSYTVYFSDGTNTLVSCLIDGILTIPFSKNTEGLTFIIYGIPLNPLMFLGAQASS